MSVNPPKSTEQIWYKDPRDFFLNLDNLTKFIPDAKMTLNEQLNAAFRFSIYFSVVVSLIRQDVRVMFFAVFIAIFTFIVSHMEDAKNQTRENLAEKLNIKVDRQKRACMMPTKNNPFMNVLMSDYTQFPTRPPACNIANKEVKQAITEYSADTIHKDIDDVFNRNASDRQFFTNPITTIPNPQSEFAHWLYNTGATCKEKTTKCVGH